MKRPKPLKFKRRQVLITFDPGSEFQDHQWQTLRLMIQAWHFYTLNAHKKNDVSINFNFGEESYEND